MKKLFSAWFKKPAETPKSSALFEILKTMREGVVIVDGDTRILASNRAAGEAFARDGGALEHKRLSEVIRDLSVHEAFRRALEEEAFSEIDGVKSAVGIFYDLTQIARLEKVRQEFLSNVSHELRTPLTSILAFVETLEDGAIEDEENNRRFLGVIRKNAERMRRLIDDILELSSIEAGKVTVQPKELELSALIAEVFTNLSAKAAERNVELENKVSGEVRVFADAGRLEQILTNLIDNAVKFNREGGSVRLRHESGDGKDLIHIEDTGEGISAEHLQRIFERFYRTDRARSREIGGTGLGLAIVKHLARLHGGEVSASSVPGKGSIFTLELARERRRRK